MKILECIARAINESGMTRVQISKETGIDEAVLCRIVNGGSCSIPTADILCEYLNLELTPKKAIKRKARK
jgi:hypothetical protein